MRLAWIEIRNFRNHAETSLELADGLTAVVGANAQGKTNLLEAMHYVFGLESPRVRNDLPLVRDGANAAFLRGEVQSAAGRYLVEVEIRASGQNRVHLNRSAVRRKRDLRRWIRSVFAGPDDLDVVQGEPDARRRFMDEAVRALWPSREGIGPAYERALRQRNRLLKEWDGTGLPAGLQGWDAELIARGVALTTARKEAVDRLSPAAGEEFRSLSGDPLMVAYRPSVQSEPLAEAFGIALAQRRGDELVRRTTLIGPHRDELEVAIRSFTVRGFASHGEAWAAALCLRLALAEALAAEVRDSPVRFLDDPFSGLDPGRQALLRARLARPDQVLIAVPDETQVPAGATAWRVNAGRVTHE